MSIHKKNAMFFSAAGLLLSLVFLSSCDNSRIFEENRALPESGWDSSNVMSFSVDIKDPATPANFYVNVRNADGYPYSNLYLFVKTKFPNGKQSNDTLECMLADENGKWLGKGIGDIYDNRIPFKRNVRFPMPGIYTFEVTQGMRTNTVPLIMDIGFRVEKAE
ncbi:MAG: gliding motility-associated lipoprotein GldH [Bacteroidetes bacterium]|nr:gliding motility-associated lipoprotein GldH [Bacteroidota bacterium]